MHPPHTRVAGCWQFAHSIADFDDGGGVMEDEGRLEGLSAEEVEPGLAKSIQNSLVSSSR